MKNNGLYIFKDPDGYFIGKKGTSLVKRITKYEYQEYKLFLPEYEVKRKKQ
jgi:hypothetical protein